MVQPKMTQYRLSLTCSTDGRPWPFVGIRNLYIMLTSVKISTARLSETRYRY